MPDGLDEKIYKYMIKFPKFIDDLETLLTENRILKQRSVDIGVLSYDKAIKIIKETSLGRRDRLRRMKNFHRDIFPPV